MKTFTPKLGILAIVIILGIGAVFIASGRNQPAKVEEQNASYSSDAPTLAAKAENYVVTTTPDPNAPKPETPPDIKVYIYPGAKVASQSATTLKMESGDSDQEITDWYKNLISKFKFNAKSFAQSNTNGLVFNKLSAAKPGEKLEVSIKKDQSVSKVTITVDRL